MFQDHPDTFYVSYRYVGGAGRPGSNSRVHIVTLPSGPATGNEEDEEATGDNVGLVLSALRILVGCHQAGLPKGPFIPRKVPRSRPTEAMQFGNKAFVIVSATREIRNAECYSTGPRRRRMFQIRSQSCPTTQPQLKRRCNTRRVKDSRRTLVGCGQLPGVLYLGGTWRLRSVSMHGILGAMRHHFKGRIV
jgi:hypothetical protein